MSKYQMDWDDLPFTPFCVYPPVYPTEEERQAVKLSHPFSKMEYRHSEETLKKMRKPKKNTENMKGPKSKEHCLAIARARRNNPTRGGGPYHFIDPNGKKVTVYYLTSFCRAVGLDHGAMSKVHHGSQGHCKGWRKA